MTLEASRIGVGLISCLDCMARSERDDIKSILKLCAGKRVDMKSLVREIHSPEECTEVYTRLINDKDFSVYVQFD